MEEKRPTIIVVDDIVYHLNATFQILNKKYNVIGAVSSEILFHILENITPDLILLDIEMPVIDGYEVCKLLKNTTKTANIPVIFYSSNEDSESRLKGLNLGAVDYIIKPSNANALKERIEFHLKAQVYN